MSQDGLRPGPLWAPVALLLAMLLVGTLGYVAVEGWSVGDALYMTVISVTTVGYGEVRPLSPVGRLFTGGLILLGVGSLFYAFSTVMAYIFEGQLTHSWERRRMEQRVKKLTDHYILCGYGRVGQHVAAELRREGAALVVIDVNQESLTAAAADGLPVVHGNAHDDRVLRQAGLEHACGLITAVADDADNIFVALSARALRPDLPIVARANSADAVHKLRLAGATRVVSPYTMAGQQMALLAVRPGAVDFVETLLRGPGGDLLVEDIRVEGGSAIVGTPVAAVRDRLAEGSALLALRRGNRLLAPPPPDTRLAGGDAVVVAGTDTQLQWIEDACRAPLPPDDDDTAAPLAREPSTPAAP